MRSAVSRWRIYLRLGRVSNLPTVWTNAWTGATLAAGPPSPETAAALALALSCFYVSGMFLNDAVDWRFDSQFRPERPIPSGLIGRGEVYAAGLVLMGLGIATVAALGAAAPMGGGVAVLASLLLAAAIIYYDYSHKRSAFSPVVMALCRALTYVVAAASTGAVLGNPLWLGAAVLATYVIGLSYVAKQESLREIENLWPLLLLSIPVAYGACSSYREPLAIIWSAALLLWVVYAVSFLVRPASKSIPRAVVSLIAGISLLDAVLIQAAGAPAYWALACCVAFGLTLLLQQFVSGT